MTNFHEVLAIRVAQARAQRDADERTIEEGAQRALAKFELDRPVRLLGVRGEFAGPSS